jgi:hypothetical protein
MSAWIVSKLHIDYLVTALVRAELTTDTPDETGRMLWRECLASVASRYPADGDGDRPGPVDFRDSDVDTYTWAETPQLSPGGLDKTLGCYMYQSCEHPGWEQSQAYALTAKLKDSLGAVEYDDSVPWGW